MDNHLEVLRWLEAATVLLLGDDVMNWERGSVEMLYHIFSTYFHPQSATLLTGSSLNTTQVVVSKMMLMSAIECHHQTRDSVSSVNGKDHRINKTFAITTSSLQPTVWVKSMYLFGKGRNEIHRIMITIDDDGGVFR